jgi:hypothetical protein
MPHLRWKKGGEADVVASADDQTTVRSTIPSAPGSRLEGELAEGGARVWLKVHRCRKDGDAFVIDGRLLDATRELRTTIAALARP